MTLDPIHFEGIANLAGRINRQAETTESPEFASSIYYNFLDPLFQEGDVVLEPIEPIERHRVDITSAALQTPPFPTQHGLDAGTINPTTFTNGLVLDIAQAAIGAVPSDLGLHRARTVVATVHSNDATIDCTEDDWSVFDDGFSRGRIIQAPQVSRYEEAVVHALSLYRAEVSHAITEAEVVEDILVLDGPIYPKGLLAWSESNQELATLLSEDNRPREVIDQYVALIEKFAAEKVPLIGFIKNSSSKVITRALRGEHRVPWVNDAAFFRRVLKPHESQRSSQLTFTSWFRSQGGLDRELSREGDAYGLTRNRPVAEYDVTFFCVYDPRDDHIYRIETPAVFGEDQLLRDKITKHVIRDIAAERGPPPAVRKADELARISREEKEALVKKIEQTFDADRNVSYDERRWGFLLG